MRIVLASEIEQQILDREFKPGELLGTIDSLRERSGFARSTVAEAIRLLAERGLAEIRVLVLLEPTYETGLLDLFLPSYSPNLSPIEEAFSKLKAFLHRIGARTPEALQEAISQALLTITAQDALGWFTHCGYRPSSQASSPVKGFCS